MNDLSVCWKFALFACLCLSQAYADDVIYQCWSDHAVAECSDSVVLQCNTTQAQESDLTFELQNNPNAQDTKIVVVAEDGTVSESYPDESDCFYNGRVNDEDTSAVWIDFKDNGDIDGAFMLNDVVYNIDPYFVSGEYWTGFRIIGRHSVATSGDGVLACVPVPEDDPALLVVQDLEAVRAQVAAFMESKKRSGELLQVIEQREVEISFYFDAVDTSTQTEAIAKSQATVAYLNSVYSQPGLIEHFVFKLLQVVMFDNSLAELDYIPAPPGEPDAGTLLIDFRQWRLDNDFVGDIGILFTGADLAGSTVGIAYIPAICSSYAVGVVTTLNQANVNWISAHEIGHILTAPHDSATTCSGSTNFLMNGAVNGNPDLSSCSLSYLNAALLANTGRTGCLPYISCSGSLPDPSALEAQISGSCPVTANGSSCANVMQCNVDHTLPGGATTFGVGCIDAAWVLDPQDVCYQTCGAFADPSMASGGCALHTHGASCAYTCAPGYTNGAGDSVEYDCNDGVFQVVAGSPACFVDPATCATTPVAGDVPGPTNAVLNAAAAGVCGFVLDGGSCVGAANCDSGFSFSGGSTLDATCQGGGWQFLDVCRESCTSGSALPDSTVSQACPGEILHEGTCASVICAAGYAPQGAALQLLCQDGAYQWDSGSGLCAAVCAAPTLPANALSILPCTDTFYGDTCVGAVTCDNAAGATFDATCQAGGTWSFAGVCPDPCTSSPDPSVGSVCAGPVVDGDSCSAVTCAGGYAQNGAALSLLCQDGTYGWDSGSGQCDAVCDPLAIAPPANANAVQSCTDTFRDDTCTDAVTCDSGSTLNAVCEADGTWTISGSCPAECGALTLPPNGDFVAPCTGTFEGQSCQRGDMPIRGYSGRRLPNRCRLGRCGLLPRSGRMRPSDAAPQKDQGRHQPHHRRRVRPSGRGGGLRGRRRL